MPRSATPLRVLHILDHSLPLHSGYTFRTLAILSEQRKLGWDTHHLTTPRHASERAEEEIDGWHFYRTPHRSPSFARVPVLRDIEQIGETTHRLEEIVRRVRPHILHAHSPVLNAIPALRVGRRLHLPVVYEVRAFWEDAAVDHGTTREGDLRYRATRALETYALKRASAVTTICEGLKGDMVARGIAESKITVIPNAVDVKAFAPAGLRDIALAARLGVSAHAPVIGFIGSFYAYEGLDLLVAATADLVKEHPELKLLLVGGGSAEPALREQVRALGIDKHVIFTGRVPNAEVGRYYDLIDVLVYPRHRMRLTELVTPLKPLEAMAQQRLVIASDVGGHKELIEHDKTGILFRADDKAALVAAVTGALHNRAQWPVIKANARQYVEQERNWTRSVSRYQQVYSGIGVNLASTV